MASHWDRDSYIKACKFAARAHQGQLYPGTELPYLMHLSFVSMEIVAALDAESGRDGDVAVACAWLHDTIEDTNIVADPLELEFGTQYPNDTYDLLSAEFGAKVANGVAALSKNQTLEKTKQMADSLDRIQQQPPEIWMVKLADRISNLQSPPHDWDKNKIIRYRDEAILIHDRLHPASPFLASRLATKIENYLT
jgi:(p)ppGpp synthase/HD superfamily hydrolase